MRKLHKTLPVFIFLMLFGAISLHSQVKIGNSPESIDSSSLLELESIDKALVISRVSTAQMEAILPLEGAMVYNTDEQCIHYYDGAEWINICEAFGALNITATAIENSLETIVITRLNEAGEEDEEGSIFNVEVSQINGDNIQDGVIDTYHIVDGAVGREQIAANAISSTEIADETIRTSNIRPGNANEVLQISSEGNVTWAALNANNITGEDLTSPNNTISITNGGGTTIVNTQIDVRDEGITTDKLAADAVDNTKLTDNAVQTENILDGAVTSEKIADETITTDDILDATIVNNDIADRTINPIKLANGTSDGQILRWNGTTTNWELANENALAITEVQDLESVLGFGADANATTITNLGTPVNDNDAATKLYVDTEIANQTIVSDDAENAIIESTTDGGAYYDDRAKEDISNKSTDVTLADDTNTNYPTELAVKTYVDTEIANQTIVSDDADNAIIESTTDGGAYYDDSAKEDVANKSIDVTLADDTNTNYPTELAVKTYVDTEIANANSLNDGQIFVGNTTNEATAVSISGDASLINDGTLTIVDDAITTAKILDGAVTVNKIASSGTNGQVLTTVGTTTTWADLPTDTNTEYTDGDGLSLTTTEFSVNTDGTTIQVNASDNLEIVPGANDQVLTTDNSGAVTWVDQTTLVPATTVSNTSTANTLSTTVDGIIGANVSIINTNTLTLNTNNELISTINGIESTALDLEPAITANQQTTSLFEGDGIAITNAITDNDTAYTVNVADDGVTTDKIADTNVTLSKLADGTAIGQLMQWDGTNWVLIEEAEINENLSNTNLIQEAERTYDLNGSDLYFSGTGSIGIGTTIPDAKLDVNGQIKGSTFKTGNGTSSLPSYRFENDNNSGMWLPVTGELALSSSGSEAIRIDVFQNVGIATTAPNSTLDVKGSFSTTIRTDNNANAIILDDDYTVILGNEVTSVELPSASGLIGRIYILKNLSGGTLITNTGYIPSASATSVDDLLSGITKLQSDGSNWQQIN